MNERLDGLLAYLDTLRKLHDLDNGYLCAKEISEAITEIKAELGIKSTAGKYGMSREDISKGIQELSRLRDDK